MLERWIKTVNPAPTWEGLAKALERPTVGEYQKAQQLRDKYLKSEESEHDDHRVMVSGKKTLEYRTISKQFSTIVDALSTSVDPASLAQKLFEAGVITESVVEKANVTGGTTPSQRIYPIVQAVRTHVDLKASKYHDFITVLQDTCPTLAKVLQKFFTTDLELNAPTVLSEVTDWEALGRHLNVNPWKLKEIQKTGTNPQHCKEELMKEWVKTDPGASWQKLSRSLDEMGEQDAAERVKGTYVSGQGSMAASKKTHEYHTISKHLSTIVAALSTSVDPASFAQKLHEADVITASVVERASVTGGTTPTERINSIIRAVRTHVCLMATKYHDFISVLQDACPTLAQVLQKFFNTDLELNSPSVLSEVSDWKSLGKNLGIDPGKLNELELSGGDLQHCKEELIKEWVETDPKASWQKIARALDRMDEQEVAERIRGTYIKTSMQEVGCSDQQKNDVMVLSEIKGFESKFDDLSFSIQSEMEETHLSPKRFRHSLTLLPESIREEHAQFLQNKLSDINKAGSIGELFSYLNLYWNFFDYALLEHIIDRFGSNQLKKQMAKYVHDLAHFRRTTTLGQFIKYWPGRAEPPPQFSEVKSHLTKNVMEYSLEELEQLRRDICFECRFKPFMLMLARVKQSSIIIVWHIPSVLVSELSDAILDTHSSFFRYHGIVKMEVDGLCVLNRKGEVQDDEIKTKLQMQQELQLVVQKSADEKVEFDAALRQKDAQLDWERRERQAMEEQFKTNQRELQLNRKEACEVREEKEKLLAAMRAQSDHERKEKETLKDQVKLEWEHQQQRIKFLEASLHRVTKENEQIAQEAELKRKQEQEEREELLAALRQRKAQVDSEVRQREVAEQQIKLERQRVKQLEEELQVVLIQKLSTTTTQESLQTKEKLLDPKETSEYQLKPKMEWQQALLEKKPLTKTTYEKEPKLTSLGEKLEETTEHQLKLKMEQQVSLEKRQLTTHEKGAPLPDWFKKLNDHIAYLDSITVSDVEADALSENLRSNTTVQILTFSNVRFSTNGLSTVLSALRENKSVKYLRLQFMTFSDTDSEVLAQVLRINTTIATLVLYCVNISDVGFTTLAEAMRDNQSLTTLDLPFTKISDSGANVLATAIQDNKTLQTLRVDFQYVSDGGARDFAKKMEGWDSTLKTLCIYSTGNISEEGKKLLRETARRKGIELIL